MKNSPIQIALRALRGLSRSKDLSVVAFVVVILAIIIVPLPSFLLDFLLVISLSLAVLIILIALYITKPTDFSSFPTLLLIVTLFRLALNVATTRMILTEGHRGAEHVSSIIAAFGEFTVSGNYVIGTIIFVILVVVNLLVVTNGSTRVTEVRARFALDAMPGKQMAIDADLNAGLIDNEESKARRVALSKEADFYGAMDGASKFVKGDAIASIIITIVNIIGGFLIGIFEQDLTAGESVRTFTILTIGDGLVGQIPALIIATATGIVATRTTQNEDENFASKLITQLTDKSKILIIVGLILLLFASVPGLPGFSLSIIGAVFLFAAWQMMRQDKKSLFSAFENWVAKKTNVKIDDDTPIVQDPEPRTHEEIKRDEERSLNEVLKIEMLELDLGYGLIVLADVRQKGELLERIRGVRKKIAHDYGFLMPQIRIRDNLKLRPEQYEIKLKGVVIGGGSVMSDKFLAMNTGGIGREIDGIKTKEPTFGMDALWIEPDVKEEAIIEGYTVVDPSTVITTHISELIKRYAPEFITKDEVKSMLSRLSENYPAIVEDAKKVAPGVIRGVLQELLREQIPIKDLLSILEAVTDVASALQNSVPAITDYVRTKLSRVIFKVFETDGVLKILTLSTESEQFLLDKLRDGENLMLNTVEMQKMLDATSEACVKVLERNLTPILIVDPKLRRALATKLSQFKIDAVVLSHAELDVNARYEIMGTINF